MIVNPIHLEQVIKIGSDLPDEVWEELCDFLVNHKDNFAWSMEDMLDLDPSVAEHKLNIDPTFIPIQ